MCVLQSCWCLCGAETGGSNPREGKHLSARLDFSALCHFFLSLFLWHPYFQLHICQLCAEELNVEHLSLGLIILLSKGFLHPEIFEIKALKNKAVAL